MIFVLRWKGENVSTIEVSNMLTELYWIEEANVYGVQIPGMYKHYRFYVDALQ